MKRDALHVLMEQVPGIVWTIDRELRFTSVHGRALARVGFEPAQLIGQTLTDVTAQTGDGHSVPAHRRALAGMPSEYTFDFGGLTFEVSVNPIYEEDDDTPSGVLGMGVDVTRNIRAITALARSQTILDLAREAGGFGTFEIDRTTDVVSLSPRARELYGLDATDVVREDLVARAHPEDRSVLDHALDALEAPDSDGTLLVEHRVVLPDDRVLWVRAVGRTDFEPIDGKSVPIRFSGVVMDITGQRQAEEELRQREQWFRALSENSVDMINVIDADGIIRYQSPSTTGALGYGPGALKGARAFDLIHPDDREGIERGMAELLAEPGRTVETEIRFRDAAGDWRTMLAVARNLIDHPHVRGIVVNSRDLTETRRIEADLQQSRRLEALGQLAGGVAHDFNNILTAIKGGVSFALHDLPEGHPVREDLEQVALAADRAADLTRQLLTFSRRQPMRLAVHDLTELLERVRPMLRRLIREDIELAIDAPPKPIQARIDPTQFEQVVLNLVVNARDAMPKGGRIRIELDCVELDNGEAAAIATELSAGRYARIVVVDDGEGIPPEVRPHIFEPFFTTKQSGVGTGLGLATVYGIVRQAGGHVCLDDAHRDGTRFEIYLPAVVASPDETAAAPQESETTGASISLRGLHVLVVEDEDAVRELARRTLERAGCNVRCAATGDEALGLAADPATPLELLLTDVILPGIAGSDLSRRLERTRTGLHTLYMSGYSEREIGGHVDLAPGAPYLQKPFDPDALLRAVCDALEQPELR